MFMFLQRLSSKVYLLFMHCHNTTWVEIVLKRLPNQLFFLLHFAFCMMPDLTTAIYFQHSQFKSYQILFIVFTLCFLVQTFLDEGDRPPSYRRRQVICSITQSLKYFHNFLCTVVSTTYGSCLYFCNCHLSLLLAVYCFLQQCKHHIGYKAMFTGIYFLKMMAIFRSVCIGSAI